MGSMSSVEDIKSKFSAQQDQFQARQKKQAEAA